MSFFRREVYRARSAPWLGTVRLTRPVGFAVVTSAALLAAVLLIAFVSFGEVNRKARLTGLLVPALGSINIAAPQAGVVSQRRIAQGDVVQPDDI